MLEKANTTFEKTVIVGIITQKQDENKLQEYLDELEFLTFTAGGEVVKRFFQKMERPNPKTFLGTGKMEESHRLTGRCLGRRDDRQGHGRQRHAPISDRPDQAIHQVIGALT